MTYNFALRKIVHVTTGTIIAWLAWELPYPEIILVAFIVMAIVLLIEYWRITDDRWKRAIQYVIHPFLRYQERDKLVGSAWLTVGTFFTVMIAQPTATVAGFLLWTFADPFGEIFGRGFRGPKLYPGAKKTWAGTIGVLLTAFLVAGLWYSERGVPHTWLAAAATAGAVTIVESLSDIFHLDDNLSIPLVGTLVTLTFLHG